MLCGLEWNDVFAPTKQHLLCDGRSALTVLAESIAASVDRSMVEDVSLLPVDKNSLFMDESALVKDKFAPPSFTYVPAVKSTNLKVKTVTKMSHHARRDEYHRS